MIQLNKQFEAIFNPRNIDNDCDKIADEVMVVGRQIKGILEAGEDVKGVTMYLQLLKSMSVHFVEDEHYCYFDDMYSPEYFMQWIYEEICKHHIGEEAQRLLDEGHLEIKESECYQDYGCPWYLHKQEDR